jgi:hypothetical protein
MFFKFSCEILGLQENLKKTTDIKFSFDSPIAATVYFGGSYPDGKGPSDTSRVVCVASTTGEIEDPACATAIHAAVLDSRDGKWVNFKGMQVSGSPVLAAVDHFFEPLRALIQSTLASLRWRSGLSQGPTDPFRNNREHVSVDGETWFEIGLIRGARIVQIPTPRQIVASPQLESDVVAFVSGGREEPLSHQLFREAWNQRGSHPRSALVIAVAAAEVGLKKLIGALVPRAEWLVDEVQTPSLGKMLRKYLPTLPVKVKLLGKSIRLPGELIKSLELAVEYRNKVVHTGKAPPLGEELGEILKAVDDFLWICDVYAGCPWAAGYISTETHAAWDDE